MAEWILVGIAILGPLLSHAMAQGINRRRWREVDDTKARQDRWHGQHFDHEKKADAEMARLQQEVKDHNKHDEERFDRIESMFREIRDRLSDR